MIVWESFGVRLDLEANSFSHRNTLRFSCHDSKKYEKLPLFPNDLEKGIILEEPNRFFLAFNAALHLVNLSSLHRDLLACFPQHKDVLDYYFTVDPERTLNILFSAPLENAQAHGNRFSPEKSVRIDVSFDTVGTDLFLEMVIHDEGNGFDWKHLTDSYKKDKKSYHLHQGNPNPHYKELFPHAQGTAMFSLLDLCDEVSFNERGNQLRLRKRLRC